MLSFLKKLFGKPLQVQKNTGLQNVKPAPENWLSSALPIIDEDIDYSKYLPETEPQHSGRENYFDTMGCTSFSALNVLETVFNYKIATGKFSKEHIDFLQNNGYIKNGKVNFSDRWLSIISSTKPIGNDFISVWNAIYKIGLIPETDLPFGGSSWYLYNDVSVLTEAMHEKAKEFKKYFEINFAWVFFGNYDANSISDIFDKSIQTSPFHVAVPMPATHAMMLYDKNNLEFKFFDTYFPYIKESSFKKSQIHYAMRAVVTAKAVSSGFVFTLFLKKGVRGYEVQKLQERLKIDADGIFGPITEKHVKRFQNIKGLVADGLVGKNTRAVLNKTIKSFTSDFEKAVETVLELEGGYVHNSSDPGGETNFGISKRAHPDEDIKNMTVERAKQIYKKNYWDVCRCSELPANIALNIFDCAVNQGVATSAQIASESLKIAHTGGFNDKLIDLLSKSDKNFIGEFRQYRIAWYKSINNFHIFGRGWVNRANHIYQVSMAL